MNRSIKILGLALCVVAAAESVQAQHDYFRSFHKEVGRLVIPNSGPNPDLVLLAVEPNFDPNAFCRLDGAEAVQAGPGSWDLHRHGLMTLDFHRLGGMQVIDEDEFLLSGSRTTSASPYTQEGRLAWIRVQVDGVNPVAYTVIQQVALPGIDPWRVAWNKNSKELHIVDYQRRRLVHAFWDHAAAGPLPTSYFEVADTTGDIAATLDPIAYSFVAMPGIGSEIEDYAETSFTLGNAATDALLDVDYNGASHTMTPFTNLPPNDDVVRLVGDKTIFGQSLQLEAEIANMTLASGTVELRDALTAQVLDSVTAVPGQMLQFSGYHNAFLDDPGRVYLLRDPTQQVGGLVFRSQLRYGDSQTRPEFSIGRGMMPAYGAAPDYPFGVGVDYQHDGSLPLIAGNLLIGFRTESGGTYTDPVTVTGTDAVLTPSITIPFQFDPTAQGATIGHEVPIDASHVGLVALFQYQFGWIDSDGNPQIVLSDVFGTRVVAQPWVDSATIQWN